MTSPETPEHVFYLYCPIEGQPSVIRIGDVRNLPFPKGTLAPIQKNGGALYAEPVKEVWQSLVRTALTKIPHVASVEVEEGVLTVHHALLPDLYRTPIYVYWKDRMTFHAWTMSPEDSSHITFNNPDIVEAVSGLLEKMKEPLQLSTPCKDGTWQESVKSAFPTYVWEYEGGKLYCRRRFGTICVYLTAAGEGTAYWTSGVPLLVPYTGTNPVQALTRLIDGFEDYLRDGAK